MSSNLIPSAISTSNCNSADRRLRLDPTASIVGLHFIPHAWLLRNPIQYDPAPTMTHAAMRLRTHYVAVFIAAGTILWITTALHLHQAARAIPLAQD